MYETPSGLYLLGTRKRRQSFQRNQPGSSDDARCAAHLRNVTRDAEFICLRLSNKLDSVTRSWNVFLARGARASFPSKSRRDISLLFPLTRIKLRDHHTA